VRPGTTVPVNVLTVPGPCGRTLAPAVATGITSRGASSSWWTDHKREQKHQAVEFPDHRISARRRPGRLRAQGCRTSRSARSPDSSAFMHLAQRPRQRRTATPHPRPGRSLVPHRLAERPHARQEARRSSPEPTAPATAGPRSARTGKARQPRLPCTPRRPPVRTDHTSHSSRTTCGPRCPARYPILIAHHFTSAFLARPL
jgi:hypothetical protein